MASYLTEINKKFSLTKQNFFYKCSEKHIFFSYFKNHRIYEDPGDKIFLSHSYLFLRSLVPGLFHCVSANH